MFQDSVNKLLVHLVLEKCSSSKNNTILAMNLEWNLANGWATKKSIFKSSYDALP